MIRTSIVRDFNIFYRILNTHLQPVRRIYSVTFENLPASVAPNTSIFHLLFRCGNFVETLNFHIHYVKSVHIFPHSGWTRRDAEYLSVFSSNAGKYEPEKLRIRTLLRRISFGDSSENCLFPQNFYIRKLEEITVFYTVVL